MDKHISIMLKQTFILDCLAAIITGVCLEFFIRGSAKFILMGMVVAFINFGINTILSHFTFKKLGALSVLIYINSYFLRILLTALIGFVIFTYNKYGTLEYVLGYTLHFISLFIYSYRIKDE